MRAMRALSTQAGIREDGTVRGRWAEGADRSGFFDCRRGELDPGEGVEGCLGPGRSVSSVEKGGEAKIEDPMGHWGGGYRPSGEYSRLAFGVGGLVEESMASVTAPQGSLWTCSTLIACHVHRSILLSHSPSICHSVPNTTATKDPSANTKTNHIRDILPCPRRPRCVHKARKVLQTHFAQRTTRDIRWLRPCFMNLQETPRQDVLTTLY